ncbi:unnamed protein product, partial [Cladocopium goreaui]
FEVLVLSSIPVDYSSQQHSRWSSGWQDWETAAQHLARVPLTLTFAFLTVLFGQNSTKNATSSTARSNRPLPLKHGCSTGARSEVAKSHSGLMVGKAVEAGDQWSGPSGPDVATANRKLSAEEVWRLQGRSGVDFKQPPLVGGFVLWRMAEENHKAGMCRDEEGPKALAPVLLWLKRWKRGELPRNEPWRAGGTEEPSTVCRWVEAWWLECLGEDGEDDSITRRAGGRRRKTAEEVIASVAKAGCKRNELCSIVQWSCAQAEGKALAVQLEEKEPRPFDGVVAHGVEEWVDEHLGGDKAISTEKAYVSSWAKWKAWARQALFAIKDAHKKAGAGDPTSNMHRV